MIVARNTSAVQHNPIVQPNVVVQSTWGHSIQSPDTAFSKISAVPQPSPAQHFQQSTPRTQGKTESTFDVLRKSPSFNLHLGDELPPKLQTYPPFTSNTSLTVSLTSVITTTSQQSSKSILPGPLKFSSDVDTRDLLKPIMVPSKEDEKPEVESFKKLIDTTYEIPPKTEKSPSIADKLLKAINQKEAAEKEHPKAEIVKKEDAKSTVKQEEPYSVKVKSPVASSKQSFSVITATAPIAQSNAKKPLLISSEAKSEEKVPIKGNVELQEFIEKLESAISTPMDATPSASQLQSAVKKQNDDSDTDSDRLVIEDETTAESADKKKMGMLESIMMQEEVQYTKLNAATKHDSKDSEKKTESGEQQSETMSLLLCEETIPGSPAPAKDPLSEIGRSPTSSGGFVHPSMPQSGYSIKYTASMMSTLHQQYQTTTQSNLKQNPMDMDNDTIEAATGDILRDKLKSERGSATSSENNTNNNSDNSNDDQSESEKNSELLISIFSNYVFLFLFFY